MKQGLNRLLPKGKNMKIIGLVKDEFGWKNSKEFIRLRSKTYSYLTGNSNEDKK